MLYLNHIYPPFPSPAPRWCLPPTPLKFTIFLYMHKTSRIHLALLIFTYFRAEPLGLDNPLEIVSTEKTDSLFLTSPFLLLLLYTLLLVGLWEAVDVSMMIWKETQLLKACSNSQSETHKRRPGIGCCSPQRKAENCSGTRGSSAVEIGKAFWHSFDAERKLCMKEAQRSRGKIPFLERDKGWTWLEGWVSAEQGCMLELLKESADLDGRSV